MFIKNWDKYLDEIDLEKKDIYCYENYCKLYETEEREAIAFVYIKNTNCFILPILIGKIPINKDLKDFETPYGYGGCITNNSEKEFLNESWESFVKECIEKKIIAGFIRFHPLLNNYSYAENNIDLYLNRNTIAIDLSLDETDIWNKELDSKNRNVIRKAVDHNLEIIFDDKLENMDIFLNLYYETMNRLKADKFYFFPHTYFLELKKDLERNTMLVLIKKKNEFIASSLILFSGIYAHYHLSASDNNFLKLSPNNFMIYKTALELKSRGYKYFHLGGGTDPSKDNSLFQFKKKFSKDLYNFYIGKIIIMNDEYNCLIKKWENLFPEKTKVYQNYLLKYRI